MDEDDLYAKLAPSKEDGGNTWNYNADVTDGNNLEHLPAKNTLYINSNIALTDGKSKSMKNSKTIPNLYDAIDNMATRIRRIEETEADDPSTADMNLLVAKDDYVNCPDGECRATSLIITPGTNRDCSTSPNADHVDSHIRHISVQNAKGTAKVEISGNDDPEIRLAVGPKNHIAVNGSGITLNGNDIRFNCSGFTRDGRDSVITMQAIVEAIRELNRRTAFIDASMGLEEAADYLDVHDEEINGVFANDLDDGLPAATNSHYSGHFIEYHDADLDCDCDVDGDVEHNAQIGYTIDANGGIDETIETLVGTDMKNNKGAQVMERGIDEDDDDPTLITPENQTIRMRGCPYLML